MLEYGKSCTSNSIISIRVLFSTGSTSKRWQSSEMRSPYGMSSLYAPWLGASASGNSRQVGLAQVFENGNRRAIIVAGQGLETGAYALWLYNSGSDAKLLGFVPERVGNDGRFATQGELPTNAEKYKQLVVTQENVTSNTKKAPAKPGTIVLQGDLKLG